MKALIAVAFSTLSILHNAHAQVTVHILDTGPGIATVMELPGNQYVLYDTGHYRETDLIMTKLRILFLPGGSLI